jgi:carbon-monoxide dehydrogenase medium subunit
MSASSTSQSDWSLHHVQQPGRSIARVLRPDSLDEALTQLADPSVRPIAGGTDLLLDLERGGPGPDVELLDLNGIDELRRVTVAAELVTLGALTTHNDVVTHPLLRQVALPLAQACLEIGSPQLRNRATVAGNVATASPANDTISALLALDATVVLRSSTGTRRATLDDFFTGFRSTDLQPGELITAIEFSPMGPNTAGMWVKLGNRAAQAISVVHLAAIVTRDDRGEVLDARLAIGSVAARVVRLPEAEAAVVGDQLTDQSITAAGEAAAAAVSPIDDVRATGEYRTETIPTLVRRTLTALRDGNAASQWPSDPPCLGRRERRTPTVGAIDEAVEIGVVVNGAIHRSTRAQNRSLLAWLRDEAGMTGAKEGCGEGECGACTVTLDGQAVMSCLVNAAQADGGTIVTAEGVATDGPSRLQQAFVDEFAVQCGFCIPGFIVAGSALLAETPEPTDEQIHLGLSGNLCRCTGYYPIEQAIRVTAAGAS